MLARSKSLVSDFALATPDVRHFTSVVTKFNVVGTSEFVVKDSNSARSFKIAGKRFCARTGEPMVHRLPGAPFP